MKRNILKTAILALTIVVLILVQSGVSKAAIKTNGLFSSSDLAGQWKILLLDNSNEGNYGWASLTVNIDESGVPNCVKYSDSNGINKCEGAAPLPTFYVEPDGLVTTAGDIIGLMDIDGSVINLATNNDSSGALQTGVMAKTANDFAVSDLEGQWNALLIDNGNPDYGWVYLAVDINASGKPTCTQFFGSYSCNDAELLPQFNVEPDGLMWSEAGVYGIMDIDRNANHLATIKDNAVTQVGVITRTSNDFATADLQGTWKIMLSDRSYPFGWKYMSIYFNQFGEPTCKYYADSMGTYSCNDAEPFPNFNVIRSGFITSSYNTIYGIMDPGRTAAYLVVDGGGVASQAGVMVKEPDAANFVEEPPVEEPPTTVEETKPADPFPELTGRWKMILTRNGSDGDYGWVSLTMDLDGNGNPTCVQYSDSNGVIDCADVVPTSLLHKFHIYDSVVSNNKDIYGVMDIDGNAADLITLSDYNATGTGVLVKAADDYAAADLQGEWKILLTDNGNPDYGWIHTTVAINEAGDPTCVKYSDSNGVNNCDEAAPLSKFSIESDGMVWNEDLIYGIMDNDKNAVHVARVTTESGVTQIGVMTKTSNDFVTADLQGKWKMILTDTCYPLGWVYTTVDINDAGEPTCLDYLDSMGTDSCSNAEPLPEFNIEPDGLIWSAADIYGDMNVDGAAAYLVVINGGLVTRTGTMTRVP